MEETVITKQWNVLKWKWYTNLTVQVNILLWLKKVSRSSAAFSTKLPCLFCKYYADRILNTVSYILKNFGDYIYNMVCFAMENGEDMLFAFFYQTITQPAWDVSEMSQSDLHWQRHLKDPTETSFLRRL